MFITYRNNGIQSFFTGLNDDVCLVGIDRRLLHAVDGKRSARDAALLVRRVVVQPLVEILNRVTDDAALTRCLGLSSLAKAQGGDVAMSVTHDALEIAGLTDAPIRSELEKLWRDAKLCQIYEGTNQLNRIEVYKSLVAGQTMAALPERRGRVASVGAAA